MFENLEAAHAAFSDFAPDALREVIAALLLQVTVLVPSEDQDKRSLTFVGGAPIMSKDLLWPMPALPYDAESFAQRGGQNHSQAFRDTLEGGLPYVFFGQVDLSVLPESDLPNTGRLLFFYDMAEGMWENSAQSAKVIWDQSPTDELIEFPLNETLIKAEADWNSEARAYVPEPFVMDDVVRKMMIDAGISEEDVNAMGDVEVSLPDYEDRRIYVGPKRLMQVEQQYQTPTPFNLEWGYFAQAVVGSSPQTLTVEELADLYTDAEIEYEYRAPFQLLGLPSPEQDDPRREPPTLNQESQFLRLLFQVSLSDWWKDENTEGTVYFLIRDSDLKAHNFDAVIAIYQQT